MSQSLSNSEVTKNLIKSESGTEKDYKQKEELKLKNKFEVTKQNWMQKLNKPLSNYNYTEKISKHSERKRRHKNKIGFR